MSNPERAPNFPMTPDQADLFAKQMAEMLYECLQEVNKQYQPSEEDKLNTSEEILQTDEDIREYFKDVILSLLYKRGSVVPPVAEMPAININQ